MRAPHDLLHQPSLPIKWAGIGVLVVFAAALGGADADEPTSGRQSAGQKIFLMYGNRRVEVRVPGVVKPVPPAKKAASEANTPAVPRPAMIPVAPQTLPSIPEMSPFNQQTPHSSRQRVNQEKRLLAPNNRPFVAERESSVSSSLENRTSFDKRDQGHTGTDPFGAWQPLEGEPPRTEFIGLATDGTAVLDSAIRDSELRSGTVPPNLSPSLDVHAIAIKESFQQHTQSKAPNEEPARLIDESATEKSEIDAALAVSDEQRAAKEASKSTVVPVPAADTKEPIVSENEAVATPATRNPESKIDWLQAGAIHALGTFLGVLLGVGASLLFMRLFVRRMTSKMSPTIRVEVTNPQQPFYVVPSESGADSSPPSPDHSERAGTVVDFADHTIPFPVVGTDYNEERQRKLALQQQQEEAILRQVLEENLELHRQASGSMPAAA